MNARRVLSSTSADEYANDCDEHTERVTCYARASNCASFVDDGGGSASAKRGRIALARRIRRSLGFSFLSFLFPPSGVFLAAEMRESDRTRSRVIRLPLAEKVQVLEHRE